MKSRTLRIPAIVFLAGLGVCAVNRTAGATASTHIWGPSADIQPYGVLHVTDDLYFPEESVDGGRLPTITNLGLTCGLLPTQEVQLEAGFDHKSGFGALDVYPLYFNAKIGIPESTFSPYFPAVAAGIFDVGTKSGVTDYNVLYAKAARTFGTAGRFSAGWFIGNDELLLDIHGEKDNSGVLAAWERTMSEVSDKLWLCVEYVGTESAYGTLNFGGSWKFADNVSVLAGYDVFNESAWSPNTVTVQVDIDLGLWGGK